MSKLSLSVYLNAYSDAQPSNNPGMNNFKWNRDLNSIVVNNPTNQMNTLAPGETRAFFNGTRTLLQDGTTEYSLSLKPLSSNTWVLQNVGGTRPNFRTPRTLATDATTQVNVVVNGPIVTFTGASAAAIAAFFTGQLPGMTTDVTITADTAGAAGNSIDIASDSVSDVTTLIAAWNLANPSNTATLTSGDGTQIPASGDFQLTGGVDATTAMVTTAVQIGDYLGVGSVFNPLNQGTFQIIGKTANSLTVEILTGTNEGPITLGAQYISQLAAWSAAGVQIGDTLVISGGFSQASWGTYEVTAVSAQSVEFFFSGALPTEPDVLTQAIAIYNNAKTLVYLESDSALNVILNGVDIGQIEPFVIPSASQPSLPPSIVPGVFMLKSTIYSLSVTNNGLNSANVYFAAVE